MSAARRLTSPCPARHARGFSLVELMVTVAIAMFLLFGLATVFDNTRITYRNQQALAQMQDQQRFAMSLITSVVEAGGYFDQPPLDTPTNAFPAIGVWAAGQAFSGTGNAGAAPGDTLSVRFRTAQNDGIINCLGGQNTTFAPDHTYTNTFSIVNGQLTCSLDNAAPVVLVGGVVNLQVYYGVKRLITTSDYNVDTYVTAATANAVPSDWSEVSAVRVILTFTNPLKGAGQNPTLQFERVIEVMGRAGDHT